jgi:hypothetical protein
MPKSRELGTAVLGGVVVGGGLAALLSIASPQFAPILGPAVGGGVAAYLLYGKLVDGAKAGVLSAILGYPFFFGLIYIMFIYGVYVPPSGPTPPLAEIQAGMQVEFLLNVVLGTVGGVVVSAARRPSEALVAPTQAPMSSVPGQPRYCVQCGAQLPAGTVICPHCGARQP